MMYLFTHRQRRHYWTTGKLLLVVLLLPLLLTASGPLAGYGSIEPPLVKAPAQRQTYTIPVVGMQDFETLDPAQARDPASVSAVQMIYTGLVSLDEDLHIQPQLAQSWELSPDGLTWTFHLKPDLTFSDGTALTAADVAYSIDRALQPTTQSRVAPLYLKDIKGAEQLLAGRLESLIGTGLFILDPQTLAITTEQPAAYFLAALTQPCSYVVQKSLIEKYGEYFTDHLDEGGGAGPFTVSAYNHRVEISFAPNEHYYSKAPQIQQVTFKLYASAEQAYQAYQDKQVDTITISVNNNTTGEVVGQELHQPVQAWVNYYAMNYLAPPFNNILIRQAFALAIDKEAIVREVWQHTGKATNHIIPEGIPGYNDQLTGPDGTRSVQGNPEKAQALFQQGLQEEGWQSVSELPTIILTYVTGIEAFDQEVQALIQQWEEVLQVSVMANPVDLTTLLDLLTQTTDSEQGLQMWGLSWVGEYPDPQNWLSLQFGERSPNNSMNYGQNASGTAALQQFTQQQLQEADEQVQQDQTTQRLELYQQAEQQIVNDVGWLPIQQMTSTILRSPMIVGMQENAHGIVPPDAWSEIYRVE